MLCTSPAYIGESFADVSVSMHSMPICHCVCVRVQKLTAAQRREAAKLYTLEQDANRGSVAGAEKRKRLFRVSINALLLSWQLVHDLHVP